MSASLVGSEMCIRDRSCVVDGGLLELVRPLLHLCSLAGDMRAWWAGPAAVSYTHLTLPTICSV
eukprot:5171313-Alexandrium_andersonii.AAC.1